MANTERVAYVEQIAIVSVTQGSIINNLQQEML